MQISEAKYYLPFVQALAEGKTVEAKHRVSGEWFDISKREHEDWFHRVDADHYDFRIKPELKLRPWKAAEVPVGALFRVKTWAQPESSVILHKCDTDFTVVIASLVSFTFREAFDTGEHSLDHGKTWLPCGVAG